MSVLQIRLKNCIQTILELEPELQRNGEDSFDEDFTNLKKYLAHVDKMELEEEDVRRLEDVTTLFLAELKRAPYIYEMCARILQ